MKAAQDGKFENTPKKLLYIGIFAAACYINPLVGLGCLTVMIAPSLVRTENARSQRLKH